MDENLKMQRVVTWKKALFENERDHIKSSLFAHADKVAIHRTTSNKQKRE